MSQDKSRRVKTIFLGDSVARQLLRPGTEPSRDVRFLTTNQAVSFAGQCYLVENALRCFRIDGHLRCVRSRLLCEQPAAGVSHDYFFAFFHRPGQVLEVFEVKRDFDLSVAHFGRMLIPNLMIANSALHPATAARPPQPGPPTTAAFSTQTLPDPEPLLTLLNHWFGSGLPEPTPQPAGTYGKELPRVSEYFLKEMALCLARNVRLHILSPPLSTIEVFSDPQHIYDARPLSVDPSRLIDPVHFRLPHVEESRRRMIEAYQLPIAEHN